MLQLQKKNGKIRKKHLKLLRKNPELVHTVLALKEIAIHNNSEFWKRVALELEKSHRKRRVVNIYKIEKLSNDSDIVVVPGKVLGSGELSKPLTVAAHIFSHTAFGKISSKGNCLSLLELAEKNPKGQGLKVIY